MSDPYPWVKLVHVLSATLLFGTGLGTAFHLWLAHLGGDVRAIAGAARSTVIADFLFTSPAALIQPATGAWLVALDGLDPLASWLVAVYALYLLIGACWLPVVHLQLRVRVLAAEAARDGTALPDEYHRLMRRWFLLGWPAFSAILAIFWLMVAKPTLW